MTSSLEFRLLNEFQRGFPLESAPFAALGARLGVAEEEVIAALARLQSEGGVSRVGAVFAPGRIGASTLAALAAPAARLEQVAALISARPEVNHNYLREHRYNLWFVATASSQARLAQALEDIGRETGCRVMSLPLMDEYHIDLGFDLNGGAKHLAEYLPQARAGIAVLPLHQDALVAALQGGLEIVPRPFARLADKAGLTESVVLAMIGDMLEAGIIKRFGVVVRHHELGYRANAMCVWDVPDVAVSDFGQLLAAEPAVTLCYRRRRALPGWPYNLFCMIHGQDREEVRGKVRQLVQCCGLEDIAHSVLFSRRRFKQRGAHYRNAAEREPVTP